MRLLRALRLLILLIPCAALAQFTTVTGTVIDPNSVPYANGTIVPILVAPGGTSVTLGGQPYQPPSQPVGLDAAGKFVMRLASTASLSPGGTGWNFKVCSAGATVGGGIGTGPQCFTLSAPISISGASQDISTQLQAVAPALSVPISGGGGGSVGGSGTTTFIPVWVSNTNLGNSPCSIIAGVQTCPALALSGTGPMTLSITYGLTPTISSTGVANLSVDPVNGLYAESVNGGAYVDFATGPQAAPGGNTFDVQANIGGSFGATDAYQILTPVTPPGGNYLGTSPTAQIVGRVEPATNLLNQFSNVLQIQGNYWTGSASSPDIWWIYEGARPNGVNSRSSLVFNHTGTNGSSNGSNGNFIVSSDNTLDAGSSCQHEDPLYSTNSTFCAVFGSANTAGSGSDLELRNTATTGSQRTRMIQASAFTGGTSITHFFETDPNTTGSAEWGAALVFGAPSAANYQYEFINGLSTNLPNLYLGGSAFSGATGAALQIQIDNGGARRLVSALAGASVDFTAPTAANAVKPFQVAAGATATVNGAAAYDQTANNVHVARNSADAIMALLTTVPTSGNCANWTVVSGSITIGDAGFACGSGGGGSPAGSPNALQTNAGGGVFGFLNSPTTNGLYQVAYNVTASTAVAPTAVLPGIGVNAQTGDYSLLYSDRANYIKESGGSTATLTLPQVTGNTASNMPFVTQNLNSGNETLTANAADKIDNSSTGGSATLLPNFAAFIYQDASSAPGNWWTVKVPTFGAFGSTGALCSWSTTTGWSCGDATGDVTTSGSRAFTLGNSGVSAGSCGDSTHSCGLTIDVKGRVTAQTNNAISGGGGATSSASVTNTTSVTVSNPTAATDTQLMELSLGASYLNTTGQPFTIHGSGVLTTTAASVPQVTITAKLCSVSGCGSGTVTPLAAIQSTALNTTAVANASWNYDVIATTIGTGASCNLIVKGNPGLVIENGGTVATADSVYADSNTAVSSPNQTCTNALFLDFFVQQSTTGASNSYKQLLGAIMPQGGGPVISVFGRTGAVGATSGDYTAAQVTNAMSKIAANTMTGSGTIDMSGLSVTAGFLPPAGAGAAPTAQGVMAFDTTNKVLQCGDGTNTNHCIEYPLLIGGNNGTIASGATSFWVTSGSNGTNATENLRRQTFPFAGQVRALCVTTTTTEPASNSLAVTWRDTTSATDSALTFTIAASSVAGQYCDNTHTATITAGHDYTIKLVETGASASANVVAGSAIYRY